MKNSYSIWNNQGVCYAVFSADFKKDEFENYGVYINNKYVGIVIDKMPNGKWEVYSTREQDKEEPQLKIFSTLKECKNFIIDLYY